MMMVTFREGLEALLIVAIALSYLRATGRHGLIRAAHGGLGFALLLSAALGVILSSMGAKSPLIEGNLALIAAVCVVSCSVHMIRHGKAMAGEIRGKLNSAGQRTGFGAALAVFLFVALMVGREGVEAATMIASLARAGDLPHLLAGAVIGFALAGLIAWAWTRYGRKVNLSLFFQVTTAFMVLFSVQLLIYAFHEYTEAGVMPWIDNEYWHVASEPYGPEGRYGAWLSYSLVLVPIAFLLRSPLQSTLLRMRPAGQ
jgi:high-affinity iron transporter